MQRLPLPSNPKQGRIAPSERTNLNPYKVSLLTRAPVTPLTKSANVATCFTTLKTLCSNSCGPGVVAKHQVMVKPSPPKRDGAEAEARVAAQIATLCSFHLKPAAANRVNSGLGATR